MKKKLKNLKTKASKLWKRANQNRLAVTQILLTLLVLVRVETLNAKLDAFQALLNNLFVNVIVNLIMFGSRLQELLEKFSGPGA